VVSIELLRRSLPAYFPVDWSRAHELDALSDWRAARQFRLGVNPYSPLGLEMMGLSVMGHPPTTPFWFLPMVDFSKPLAAELCTLTLLFLIAPHIYLCAKELRWPAPVAVTALFTSLAISSSWILYHYSVIQLSEPIAFLYLLSWIFLRHRNDARAGICIGIAATLKLFPGLMIIMLLVARRWPGLFFAIFTYGIVAGIMTWTYGIESWQMFFAQQKPIADTWLGSLQNSSLSGLVTQILYPFCDSIAYPSKEATVITTAGATALVTAAIWYSRSHINRALDIDARAIDLPFTLFALLSVFLNPWVWEHYYVFLIQPLFLISTLLWITFRRAFRTWSDESTSSTHFAVVTCLTGLSFASLAFILRALSREIWETNWYVELWKQFSEPIYHWYAHYLQIQNISPWIILIILCFINLHRTRRTGVTML
jgi:hypothetical protein